MPNTKEKGKLIEVLSKHIPYGYATLCLIADELMADGVRLEEKRATSDGCITMDVHGKLMGLLQRAPYIRCEDVHRQYAVNWLMNNGVTVQEWIPVTERLPDKGVIVLVSDGSDYPETAELVLRAGGRLIWENGNFREVKHITHWMPLPQPPNEVEQ